MSLATARSRRTNVFQVAGSKLQASLGTEYATQLGRRRRPRRSPARRAKSVVRRDGRGAYTVVSSDGRLAHGRTAGSSRSPTSSGCSRATPRSRPTRRSSRRCTRTRVVPARDLDRRLQPAVAARPQVPPRPRLPEVETRREGFLTIGRDPDAGFLMWWYGMPQGYELDLEDDKAVLRALKLANPGSWTDHRAMLRSLRRAMNGDVEEGDDIQDELEWLRLCLNYWTSVKGSWLKPGAWRARRQEGRDPARRRRVRRRRRRPQLRHDRRLLVVVQPRAAARSSPAATSSPSASAAPAHTYVDDFYDAAGDEHVAERFIHEKLATHGYRVREVVGDPNYFGRELARLGQRFKTAPIFPQSNDMREYVQRFYRDVHGAPDRHRRRPRRHRARRGDRRGEVERRLLGDQEARPGRADRRRRCHDHLERARAAR
jgi:hypothetical protein